MRVPVVLMLLVGLFLVGCSDNGRYQVNAQAFKVVVIDTKTGAVKLVARGDNNQYGIPFEKMSSEPLAPTNPNAPAEMPKP